MKAFWAHNKPVCMIVDAHERLEDKNANIMTLWMKSHKDTLQKKILSIIYIANDEKEFEKFHIKYKK